MSVAETILTQLGGRKFSVMTGSKNFVSNDKEQSLSMKLTRNNLKATYLTIKLTVMDTYTMEFMKFKRNFDKVSIKTIEGVYAEDLQSIFTEETGLYTKF